MVQLYNYDNQYLNFNIFINHNNKIVWNLKNKLDIYDIFILIFICKIYKTKYKSNFSNKDLETFAKFNKLMNGEPASAIEPALEELSRLLAEFKVADESACTPIPVIDITKVEPLVKDSQISKILFPSVSQSAVLFLFPNE